MTKQTGLWLALVVVAMASTSGCTRLRNKSRDQATAQPWDVYPEAIGDDLIMRGERFEETRQSLPDVRFENVLFGFDSFQVPAAERPKVEEVADYLRSNPDIVVVVEGHCDERGSREYNLSLGEQRAQAVRSYLVNLGISPDRIQTVSFGKERPIDPGHNEAAWRLNRRAEFVFYR